MANQTPTYHPEDLIDDRELKDANDDELSHEPFARQLTAIALSIEAPANIALFGPWGSGKSGIANLVKKYVEEEAQSRKGRASAYRFARFDAFKYADNPLRRNFISAVARELNITDRRFSADLYADQTTTDVTLTRQATGRIVGIFAVVLGVVAAVGLLAAFFSAWIIDGSAADKTFDNLARKFVSMSIVPSALLTALIGLLGAAFQVKRSTSRPESDEEFETLLGNLVVATQAERIVIFVDELDRCSAEEVVGTLDAIRTFLGVARCVFIIAADQSVLEQALTAQARQETPHDQANPYYSAGSAYLDKVFQYQVTLPPLMPQSITKYAVALVASRTSGVWAEVDANRVASVLIPSHVSSPRRVKHMMNAFALTYRSAEARYQAGQIAVAPLDAAQSLAKLTCIRVEFPRFARHLETDPDLIKKVLEIKEGATSPGAGAAAHSSVAQGFADGTEETATLIAPSRGGADTDDSERDEIIRQQGRDLLHYLNRTRNIQGPGRDLIFMQSKGSVLGLDDGLAGNLERVGADNQVGLAENLLEPLDQDDRLAALRFYIQQMRHEVGIESENFARTTLDLISTGYLDPTESAEEAADVIASLIDSYRSTQQKSFLDEGTADGAWILGMHGRGDGAAALRRTSLAYLQEDATRDAAYVLADGVAAVKTDRHLLRDLVSDRFVSPGTEAFVGQLSAIEPAALNAVMHASAAEIGLRLKTLQKEVADQSEAEAVEDPSEFVRIEDVVAAMSRLAIELAGVENSAAYPIVTAALSVDTSFARNSVEEALQHLPRTSDRSVIRTLLQNAVKRTTDRWQVWLDVVDASGISGWHTNPLGRLLKTAVARVMGENSTDGESTFARAMALLLPLWEKLPADKRPKVTEAVVEAARTPVRDASLANRYAVLRAAIGQLADAGVVELSETLAAVSESIVSTLEDSLVSAVTAPRSSTQAGALVGIRDSEEVAASVKSSCEFLTARADRTFNFDSVLEAAQESSWLEEPDLTEIVLLLEQAVVSRGGAAGDRIDAGHIGDLLEQHGSVAAEAAALWIRAADPSPEDVHRAIGSVLTSGRVPPPVAVAVEAQRSAWSAGQRRDFRRPYIEPVDAALPPRAVLDLLGVFDGDESETVSMLVRRFTSSTNNPERKRVLDLWVAAEFADSASHRVLLNDVAIPMIALDSDGSNEQASAMVLNALAALGRQFAPAQRRALGAVVETSARHHESIEERAKRVLPGLGFGQRSLGLLRRSGIDYQG